MNYDSYMICNSTKLLKTKVVTSTAMSIGIHVSLSVMVFSGYMLNSGIAGSYGSSVSRFSRNLHTVLQSGCVCQVTSVVSDSLRSYRL